MRRARSAILRAFKLVPYQGRLNTALERLGIYRRNRKIQKRVKIKRLKHEN